MTEGVAKEAVIIGAGPAGTTAALLLAKDGWSVKVFDKRPEPEAYEDTGDQKSIVIALVKRGNMALQEAGVKLPSGEAGSIWCDGLAVAKGITIHAAKGSPAKLRKVEPGITFSERSAWVQHLRREASRLYPEKITYVYGRSLHSVDFKGRQARFSAATGGLPAAETHYDLLIGADGRNSATRAILAEHQPNMHFKTHGIGRSWKSFTDLPIPSGLDIEDDDGVTWHVFSPGPIRVVAWPTANKKFAGYVVQPTSWFTDETNNAQAYEAKLRRAAPGFPEEWIENVANQLVDSPAAEIGVAWCSLVCGPSTVLIGDAANAVTPLLGQGMNSALESCSILAKLLREHDDVDAACEAFQAARLPDLHALSQLDREWPWRNGSRGKLHFTFLSTMLVNFTMWGALHRCMPSLIGQPEGLAMQYSNIAYSKVLRALHRDDAIFGAVLASITLASGLAVRRWRSKP